MSSRVDGIASALISANIQNGERIGVFQEPSNDWICSLLAILRIGAVYVPLDLRSNASRLALIVNDCGPSAILCDANTFDQVPALHAVNGCVINVSTLPESNGMSVANQAKPNSPAAIIYTSGSTGTPKGTVLMHSGLRNNIEGNTEEFRFAVGDCMLQQIALSFDYSMWQIFMAISNGAALYVVPKTLRGDAAALVHLIVSESITVTGATPSEYVSWLRYGNTELLKSSKWRMAISAGEEMTGSMKQEFRGLEKPDLKLFNGYGPTEGTLSCNKVEISYSEIEDGSLDAQKRTPVGYTAPNYSIYIVDENLNPLPVGMPGQVLIGGAGVAAGYLNNEDMSVQRFRPDPHAPPEYLSQGWDTVHLTGDSGRLRSDGALIIEGRIAGDTQIKLRGLRIDLRDIETTIVQKAQGVLYEAVVSLRRSSSSSPEFLVAYVLFSPKFPQEQRDQFLRELTPTLPLPQYMCPTIMIPLDRMPMSAHWKLDRAAINALELPTSSQTTLASISSELTDFEHRLMEVWEQVITPEVVSFHELSKSSDFFHSGGNSLLLVSLKAEIAKVFGIDLPLVQLFEDSTLENMALRIQSSTATNRAAPINWKLEGELHDLSENLIRIKARPRSDQKKVVVLTGATGFLGKAILQQLVSDTRVAKIHCIAVRSSPRREPLLSAGKVVVHAGDLTLPRLGLSETLAVAMFNEADLIIHNGADVSFLKSYLTLKRPNVDSTLELLRMAIPTRVPFHYISTTGVANLSNAAEFAENAVTATREPSQEMEGYIASKWVSEQLLEKAADRFRIPVTIHRPSNVLGDDAPALDVMHNIIKFSREMKAVPEFPSWEGYLDFITVDRAAAGIIAKSIDSKKSWEDGVVYYHQSGEVQLPLTDMHAFMEKQSGTSYRSITLANWIGEAETAGLDKLVAAYLKRVESEVTKVTLPKILKRGSNPFGMSNLFEMGFLVARSWTSYLSWR
jgi:hybrid polyketide synthase / nonribosomal peptide synthetase ACE1